MTRIGSFAHQQNMINFMLANQDRTFTSHTQVTTGKRAEQFQDISRESTSLLRIKSSVARIEGYQRDNNLLKTRLNNYDLSLQSLEKVATDVRKSVLDAISSRSGLQIADTVGSHLSIAIGLLNSRVDGQYIFGGTRADSPPVNITDAAGLLATAQPATAAFDNNNQVLSARIDDNQTIDYGMLADDVGQPLLRSIQRLLLFNSGTLPTGAAAHAPAGAFTDPLADNQKDFLQAELDTLTQVMSDLAVHSANNGTRFQKLEDTEIQMESVHVYMTRFVSDTENVDIAEAMANLNRDQTALQASLSVVGRLGSVTLLDYL